MNSFELNKVLGAVLGTCLILLAINLGAQSIFATEQPAKPGYKIVVAKAESGGKPAAKEPEIPLPVLLAKAERGQGQADRPPVRGLPYLRRRASPTRSVPISTTSSAMSAARTAAASTSPRR